jgi:hypothetical protein
LGQPGRLAGKNDPGWIDAEDGMADEAKATGTEADANEGEKTPKTTPATPVTPGKVRRDERIREERNTLKATLDPIKAQLAQMAAQLQAQTEAREKAEKAALDANRKAIAAKHKLPDEFAARLVGATEEELEADAKKLAAALPKPAEGGGSGTTTTTTTSAANPAGTPTKLTMDEIRKMSTAEINKRWEEVQQVMAGN